LATRDLKLLVDAGLLEAHGEKRGRFYQASQLVRDIRRDNDTRTKSIQDPFSQLVSDLDENAKRQA
jgi:hypothetical protein